MNGDPAVAMGAAEVPPGTGAGPVGSGLVDYGIALDRLRLWVRATEPWSPPTAPAAPRTVTLPRALRAGEGFPSRPQGSGRARVVYVHGLGGSRTNWTDLMGLLRDEALGQAVDLPGYGESPPPDNGDFTVSGFAWNVAHFIEHGGDTPVDLVGNSLGGAIATRIAALRPDLVRTLTLISPALPNLKLTTGTTPIALLGLPAVGSVLTKAYSRTPLEERVRRVFRSCYGEPDAMSDEALAAAVEEARRYEEHPYAADVIMMTARGLVAEYLTPGPSALWRQAAEVSAPTLLVYGRRDRLVDPRKATKAWRTFPDARLLTLPTAGHVAMMEYPDVVASGIRQFWRSHSRELAYGGAGGWDVASAAG